MNMVPPVPFPGPHGTEKVAFHRSELAPILSLYGRFVAAGEWRDYGISNLRDVAVFAVFRRSADTRFTGSKSGPGCGCGRGNTRWSAWTGRCSSAATTCARCCGCWSAS